MAGLCSTHHASAQEEAGEYWYDGFVRTSEMKPIPLLTITLTERGAKTPKAVTMTSPAGYMSFVGVAVDIHKDHILSVYRGDTKIGDYLQPGAEGELSFKGNINAHLEVEAESPSCTTKSYQPSSEEQSMMLREYLRSALGLEVESEALFLPEGERPLALFVNNATLPREKLSALMEQLPAGMIRRVILYRFDRPGKYFDGAVSIELTAGQLLTFPEQLDSYHLEPLTDVPDHE